MCSHLRTTSQQVNHDLVAIVFWLVGAFYWDAEVFGLGGGELGEFYAELGQMQAGDFFVEFFWQAVDAQLKAGGVLP